jgi:hypothetical protein
MINIRFSQKKEERSGIFYDINKKISDFISNKIEKKINLLILIMIHSQFLKYIMKVNQKKRE